MKLNVFVSGRAVATLESVDNFEFHLTYLDKADPKDFVSLQMPVRAPSWRWPALHPFFQVSLPEGYLLSVLKEQLGPHLGASPLDLLAVVGHNLIGRVQVSAGSAPTPYLAASDLHGLLHGASSQGVFLELMAQYAVSGVSGVVPKFLTPETQALFRKGTVTSERHIVKASSAHQPFVALNEHLCMQVAAATGFAVARTQVSEDGQILVVERFDIDPETGERKGFEDFCSLLGLPPDNKYDATWERVARLARDYVAPAGLRQANEQLAVTLLLTYALGNADCHTKNLAFVYSSFDDVQVAPIYDMLTILAYDRYADNPPGLYVDGRKSWDAGKANWRFLQQHLGVEPARQRELADLVATSISEQVPEVLHHMKNTPGFAVVGGRMLWEWQQGVKRLNDRITVPVSDLSGLMKIAGFGELPQPPKFAAKRLDESPLLAPRKRTRPTRPS
ncbi:MAG: type II toxin-antitoxin system HipA family toxin [Rhodoferax sp.]|uniref:type II toxin-antitoxin system HipA family toxin n=1 Tax=Rhodoferax sp. TaxID=50421 RepID=UPI003017A52D